jgi:hypothetical protein
MPGFFVHFEDKSFDQGNENGFLLARMAKDEEWLPGTIHDFLDDQQALHGWIAGGITNDFVVIVLIRREFGERIIGQIYRSTYDSIYLGLLIYIL